MASILPISLPTKIDYTARDFDTSKAALVQYLKDKFPSDFTDFTESQLGVAILELFAYLADNDAFYLDREANERYFVTARQRRNIILLAKNIGYIPYLASAASVDVLVDTSNLTLATNDIFTVLKGQKLTSTGGVVFEIINDFTLICTDGANKLIGVNGGTPSTTPAIGLVQGESKTFSGTSNGQPFQTFLLDQSPVIDGSIVGYVGGAPGDVSAVQWTSVDSLPLGDPSDVDNQEIFVVTIDENDQATIKFGDNITGNVPPNGSPVSFTYRVGGGSSGNIAANTLSGTLNSTKNGTTPVGLTVQNADPATGGQDREDNSSIKFFAPLWVKTNDRAITYNDYFTLSNGFTDGVSGSIAKAGVICDPSDGISNVVTVYVWTKSSDNILQAGAPSALRDSLQAFLDARRVVTVYVQVVDGTTVPVDLNVLLQLDTRFNATDVTDAVRSTVANLFTEDRVRYGNELRISWIYDEIMSVPGVRWCHITTPIDTIETGVCQELAAGTLGTQGAPTISQVTLPATFSSGALPNSGLSVDGTYCSYRILMTSGVCAGQVRKIIGYVGGGTRLATLDNPWLVTNPVSGNTFKLLHPRFVALATTANAASAFYNRKILSITSGAGINQNRVITSYDGTYKIATIDKSWTTYPDSTSNYLIVPDLRCAQNESLILGTLSLSTISSLDES